MMYHCKFKLSLEGIVYFEVGKLYEGNFDKETNCYWFKVLGGETPIQISLFETHFEKISKVRDRKLKQILK